MSEAAKFEQSVEHLGNRSATFFERFGLNRLAAGILLIVLGILVIIFPALIAWTVGIGAIVLGTLVLASAPTWRT